MRHLALLLALVAASPLALAVDVEGYVYTIEGQPIAGATVSAGSQRATTTDDGHFKITAPADSVVALEVRAGTHPPARVVALAGDPPLTITVGASVREDAITSTAVPMRMARDGARRAAASTRDRVLTGTVRLGKRVLANAPVIIHGMGEFYTEPLHVKSDDKGRFRAEVPAGRYVIGIGEDVAPRLRSIHDGRMHVDGERELIDLTEVREASQDVELIAAPMITGRVLDSEGKPVGRADVNLIVAGRSPLEFLHQPIVRTLPDGRFAIVAPPFQESESVEIVVTPSRHSAVRSKPFPLSNAKSVTITLPKFEPVTLRVVGREGKPVPNATIGYALAEEIASYADPAVLLMPHVARRRVTTDAESIVTLHLEAGRYELAAVAPGYQQRVLSRDVTAAATVEIALEAGHQIRGRVRRGEQPVAGVQVMLRGGNAPRGERTATTDAGGRFLFDSLPAQSFTVAFFKHDEMIDKMLTVEAPADVDLDLPPVVVLRGRVIDARSGNPVTQFLYTLEPLDAEPEARRMRGHQQRGGGTGGTFEATVPVGAYRIVAAAEGFLPSEPQELRVTAGEPAFVEIALSRGASVTGTVLDEQGSPVREAQVMLVREPLNVQRSAVSATRVGPMAATTGDDGAFTISGIEDGPATLIVRRAGFATVRRAIDVDGTANLDITLSRGLTLSGTVTLRGKPAPGASVDAITSAIDADHQSAVADDQGRFTLQGLVPARYTLNANFENHHAEFPNVDVPASTPIVIELDRAGRGTVFGTVTGIPRTAGKATRGTVFVQSTHRGAEGPIDPDGSYRIENTPAGSVEVVAHVETNAGSRATSRKRMEIGPGEAVRVDLDLTPALVVTGRVTHGSNPVGRTQIMFSGQNSGMVSTTTASDGTYEVGLPEPGRYYISAHAEELMSRQFQTVREFRGSETFNIHLAEQTIEGVVLDAATSRPIANAMVTLVAPETLHTGLPAVTAETITDAAGRFTILSSAAGPHLLIASAAGHAHQSREIVAGGETPVRAQFQLAGAAELRVRAVDARRGTPLQAHITIADEKGTILPVRSIFARNGDELIFSVARGKYRLTAISMGYAQKTVEASAPGAIVIPME